MRFSFFCFSGNYFEKILAKDERVETLHLDVSERFLYNRIELFFLTIVHSVVFCLFCKVSLFSWYIIVFFRFVLFSRRWNIYNIYTIFSIFIDFSTWSRTEIFLFLYRFWKENKMQNPHCVKCSWT